MTTIYFLLRIKLLNLVARFWPNEMIAMADILLLKHTLPTGAKTNSERSVKRVWMLISYLKLYILCFALFWKFEITFPEWKSYFFTQFSLNFIGGWEFTNIHSFEQISSCPWRLKFISKQSNALIQHRVGIQSFSLQPPFSNLHLNGFPYMVDLDQTFASNIYQRILDYKVCTSKGRRPVKA